MITNNNNNKLAKLNLVGLWVICVGFSFRLTHLNVVPHTKGNQLPKHKRLILSGMH